MKKDQCEIRIFDSEFNWINVVAQPEYVRLTRELYGGGSFEIHIHPDKIGGMEFPWQSRYQNLKDELANIGAYGEMGYEIYADYINSQWVFEIIEGAERTKSQNINDPVYFNMKYQNMDHYKYSEDYVNYKNTGYAGGQREDENRLIYTLGADNTGLDRWEIFLDCGNAEHINELMYYGGQKLNEYEPAKTIEANALPRVFLFNKDYFLGDKVTVYISRLDVELDTRITSVKEIWDRQAGHNYEIRFGEELPNLYTVLKQKEEVR